MTLTRRDAIVAGIVAFIAWGFVTHWIPTLRLLPYAFLAGVLLTIAALGWILLTTSRGTTYGGRSSFRHPGSLAFTSAQAWKKETTALKERVQYQTKPLYPSSFVISDSIDSLLDLILEDFITSWYSNISKNPTFPNEIDRATRAALSNIRERLFKIDVVDVVVSRIIPIFTRHMKDFDEAERLVRGKNLTRNVTESDELDSAIAGKYREGTLHPAASLAFLDNKLLQQQHLRKAIGKIIPHVLPSNMTTSTTVLVLIKEIVAYAVLLPLVQMLADPDVLNQFVEGNGRNILQDRKSVRRLRAALDQHAPPPPSRKSITIPKLTPGDSERTFEKYMRAIRHCNNLPDAQRLHGEVTSQLKREAAVSGQDRTYVRRLQLAKQALDQRVSHLSGTGPIRPPLRSQSSAQSNGGSPGLQHASLREVLYNASGLSYFMEYMDRLRLMSLVRFWIIVDSLRNPLEEYPDVPPALPARPKTWTESDRINLIHISDRYMQKPELKVSDEARKAVHSFVNAGSKATRHQYQAARRALVSVQSSVYEEMQNRHFPNFKKSDLFYKCLAACDTSEHLEPPAGQSHVSVDAKSVFPARPSLAPRPSQINRKQPEFRRAAASSSDLTELTKQSEAQSRSRRSLDETKPRQPLFDDDFGDDPLSRSSQRLDSDSETTMRIHQNDREIVDAMQAALGDIMDEEGGRDSLFLENSVRSPQDSDFLQSSFDEPQTRTNSLPSTKDKGKPSIASLGLVGDTPRRGVFSDDDLFGEEEKFLEDEHDSDVGEKTDIDDIQEAEPGDLGLAEAVAALKTDIDKLTAQEAIIDSLTSKAELTNNAAELRILRKSKMSLQKEIQGKEHQKQRYVIQESDNSLFGRASVSIKSVMVGTEPDGTEYALYVIEVQRQAGEKLPTATWVVARRYSQFHALHKRLRSRYAAVRKMEFPRRQVVLTLQKDLLRKRQSALERYQRELLLIPAICRSRELRAFLSQRPILEGASNSQQLDTHDFVARIYSSVSDGMEEFFGNAPVLDQLSLAGQNLASAATAQLNSTAAPNGVGNDPASAAEAEAELHAFENRELEPFVKPICDLFLETFELNRGNNWLRGRAVVVVLHQLLGGTIERKVRENFKSLTQEDAILRYVSMIKDTMWPGGKPKVPSPHRTDAQKERTRKEAGLVLAMLIPEMAGSVVGRANAVAAARKVFATFNNRWLNTHLVFTIFDEIVRILFPDAVSR